jgi:hypothetical protein
MRMRGRFEDENETKIQAVPMDGSGKELEHLRTQSVYGVHSYGIGVLRATCALQHRIAKTQTNQERLMIQFALFPHVDGEPVKNLKAAQVAEIQALIGEPISENDHATIMVLVDHADEVIKILSVKAPPGRRPGKRKKAVETPQE